MSPDLFSKLLHPISLETPCGDAFLAKDTPADNAIYTLNDLRRSVRKKETTRASDGISQLINGEDWNPVFKNASEICMTLSKDFTVIASLIESLTRIQSFSGLFSGLSLLKNLIENYHEEYEKLYTEDPEALLIPIEHLTGSGGSEGLLNNPVRLLPLTEEGEFGPFALWQCQQAIELKKIMDPEIQKQKIDKGCVQFEHIQKAILATSSHFIKDTLHSIEESIIQCGEIQNLINDIFPTNNVSFTQLKNGLSDCSRMLNYLYEARLNEIEKSNLLPKLKEINPLPQTKLAIIEENKTSFIPHKTESNPSLNTNMDLITKVKSELINMLKTKDDVIFILEELTKIYKQLEPHSPVSYMLNKSLKWSKMELSEFYDEFTHRDNTNFYSRLLKGESNG